MKEEYVIIFKWHPALYNNLKRKHILVYDESKYKDFFYDMSEKREVNDLLFVADILVTDYSSVIFDYALLNKPIIYFMYDIELDCLFYKLHLPIALHQQMVHCSVY